ncbi:nucleotide-sugar transporter-domain-containing protein [Halteromyces radiatus]|uniref:nucleotide-sugar transporter-domain-containing protein n=1 Tax=Halteromyces radiatus TaxID=101107 RepID=UPI0022200420|nr:nucleotide-sugar transporter-domain-containing protein [Halteromyces radiatus]KAI8097043.1 nucleotide-sugar transporter-domain-containing protein [Halteromyces radiatus]
MSIFLHVSKVMVSLDAHSVKWLSLLILVIQNSTLILVMRYTRTSVENDQLYLASTAVVMSEVLKTLICLLVLYQLLLPSYRHTSLLESFNTLGLVLRREMLHNWHQAIKLAVPAILYLIQNNLQYVAATHLDAATFQVTYQLKILTTAFFSVILLHRSLSSRQWIALGLLTVGVALVMLPKNINLSNLISLLVSTQEEKNDDKVYTTEQQGGATYDHQGFMAVLMACILSGMAGVYFEKLLKSSSTTTTTTTTTSTTTSRIYLPTHQLSPKEDDYELKKKLDDVNEAMNYSTMHTHRQQQQQQLWIRNMQMSFFSVILGLVFVVGLQDADKVLAHGFFAYYTRWTWCVIMIQACGGLIVAVVVKYADSILKGFATSISIILSTILSVWLFQVSLSFLFVIGASLVIYATYLYGLK